MSTTVRSLIQLVALVALVAGGWALYGWVGALAGFGIFVVAMVAVSVRLMRTYYARQAEAEVAAESVAAETASTGAATRPVKAPQDYRRKTRKQ